MSAKRSHPSADRNSKPISIGLHGQLDLLTPELLLLEVSSGSGQHAGFLAPLFPNITFQPTEYDCEQFSSISAYAAECSTQNIRQPLFVDIAADLFEWKEQHLLNNNFDYMLNCNMMHITPWRCSEGLFRAAGKILKSHGKLFTYGPYAVNGVLTPESNVAFDKSLRSRNPDWGVRDIAQLKKLAQLNGLRLISTLEMPSNNKLLTWMRD